MLRCVHWFSTQCAMPTRMANSRCKSHARQSKPVHVRIGVDGLSIAQGAYRGILLPQVAVEEHFDAADFLSQACMKAGLLADAWLDPATRVYTFQAEVFAEVGPRGPVVRRKLEAARAGH